MSSMKGCDNINYIEWQNINHNYCITIERYSLSLCICNDFRFSVNNGEMNGTHSRLDHDGTGRSTCSGMEWNVLNVMLICFYALLDFNFNEANSESIAIEFFSHSHNLMGARKTTKKKKREMFQTLNWSRYWWIRNLIQSNPNQTKPIPIDSQLYERKN